MIIWAIRMAVSSEPSPLYSFRFALPLNFWIKCSRSPFGEYSKTKTRFSPSYINKEIINKTNIIIFNKINRIHHLQWSHHIIRWCACFPIYSINSISTFPFWQPGTFLPILLSSSAQIWGRILCLFLCAGRGRLRHRHHGRDFLFYDIIQFCFLDLYSKEFILFFSYFLLQLLLLIGMNSTTFLLFSFIINYLCQICHQFRIIFHSMTCFQTRFN